MKKASILFLLLFILMFGFSIDLEAQCAMCKATLESNMQNGEGAVGKGINAGIKYIMFVPYLLMAVVGYFVYKHHMRNK